MQIWSHPHNSAILPGCLWSSVLLLIIATAEDKVMVTGAKIVFWLEIALMAFLLVMDALILILDRIERKQ